MRFDYRRLAATADRLLERFGAPLVMRRTAGAEYDPETSTVDGDDVVWTGRAVRTHFELRDIDGETIRMTDVRLLVSPHQWSGNTPLAAEFPQPQTGDRIEFDGAHLVVQGCRSTRPAGTSVLYDVHVRV